MVKSPKNNKSNINANFLQTETPSLIGLFESDITYIVPKYQRSYSWNEEEWENLWSDIEELEDSEYPHFMGAIVLQKTNDAKEVDIIDGQQRLTTLSIFIIAILDCIQNLVDQQKDRKKNKERIGVLSGRYIAYTSASTLSEVPKITLNYINADFFTHKIIGTYLTKKGKLKTQQIVNENESNKLIFKALEYFKKQLSNKLKGYSGEEIVGYFEKIGNKLKFIQIIVQDELNAYTLFETLNARGVELTATDLLKNYLFSILKSDEEAVNSKWNAISESIGGKRLPDYLRCIINSERELVRQKELFKRIKKDIASERESMRILNRLYDSYNLYNALQDPNHELWNSYSNKRQIVEHIKTLNIFGVIIPISLLLISLEKLIDDDFIRVLKACTTISIRYSITQRRTNVLEKVYNKIACEIFNGNYTKSSQVLQELSDYYIQDDVFKMVLVCISKKLPVQKIRQ